MNFWDWDFIVPGVLSSVFLACWGFAGVFAGVLAVLLPWRSSAVLVFFGVGVLARKFSVLSIAGVIFVAGVFWGVFLEVGDFAGVLVVALTAVLGVFLDFFFLAWWR